MTLRQRALKRAFDVVVSASGLFVVWPIIVTAILIARRSTGLSGVFRQERVGRGGKPFDILKIRTMRPVDGLTTTVTIDGDPRITRAGRFFRKTKIDELPQLWNVLRGDMSLVGPRPDVAAQIAYTPSDKRDEFLSVRPGITGPASLKYRDEEGLLAASDDPQWLNNHIIWPDKVAINSDYIAHWSLLADIRCLIQTALPNAGEPIALPEPSHRRRAA